MTELQQAMLHSLKEMRTNGPRRNCVGICDSLEVAIRNQFGYCIGVSSVLQPLFVIWELYSGDETFPVPSGIEGESASIAYLDTPQGTNIWDKDTAYGRNRWALLDHLIQELEKQDAQ